MRLHPQIGRRSAEARTMEFPAVDRPVGVSKEERMRIRFDNPWGAVREHLWLFDKACEMAAKCIDPELLLDPQAPSECCLQPPERRLNPLEFHGKRCCDAST
jgi:hypothetical protein